MKTTFIYALCEPGTRVIRYIGKADDPFKRLEEHLRITSRKQWHCGKWLKNVKSKNKTPALLFLKEVPKNDWQDWEQCYIRNARMLGFDLTNATEGGEGLCNPSEKTRQLLRETKLGEKNPGFGKPSWNKGKKLTKEHRKNLCEAKVGCVPWNKGKKTGPQSKEHVALRTKKITGKKRSTETRAKMSAALIGNNRRWGNKKGTN